MHGEIVAPPVMLQAWVMRGIKPRPATGGTAQDELMRLLGPPVGPARHLSGDGSELLTH